MLLAVGFAAVSTWCGAETLQLKKDDRIAIVGGGLGARMMDYGYFESLLFMRYPQHNLVVRNMCDEGDTPAFRPHSGYGAPWAYPGAENSRKWDKSKKNWPHRHGNGFNRTAEQWLQHYKVDVVIAMFGYAESFDGPSGVDAFKQELDAYVKHTMSQKYNGESGPKMALVSPAAFQDLSAVFNTPDGAQANKNLKLYADAIKEVANANKVPFVDLFTPTQKLFEADKTPYSRDGALLNDAGYRKLAPMLVNGLVGEGKPAGAVDAKKLRQAVLEKNWVWLNYYKVPNGVHVFGERHKPYGPDNYPFELKKLDQMVAVRDQAAWAVLAGKRFDLAAADAKTDKLPLVKSNKGKIRYLSPERSLRTIQVPKGYKIELFADEKRFPDLANPCQMAFDNKGRLWVAVMPSYPHYCPGDPKPNDKILIFEDTNNDGRADRQIVFADNLHLIMGFEITHDGVYVAQGYQLLHLKDTDGDDKADWREVALAGFSDHDTHHAISAFCADPSGAFMMGEGWFLLSHVETAYGPVRSHWSGFHRYDPSRRKLERTVNVKIPNPWGIAFDEWGQDFFAHTSGPSVNWMLPASIQVGYGNGVQKQPDLLKEHRVRPTSGLEFVSSRHFPDEVQGDMLINNNIGFLGTKQHAIDEEGTGYKVKFRQDLVKSSDSNFRPVDMEFAPDGSLYLIDWHNGLIGHMQHNARDPNRDHAHGRVYRITYPSRPLVKPAPVAGASIAQLLKNLEQPEYRTRYRTRRELRGRDAQAVFAEMKKWLQSLDQSSPRYEHHLVEALWVSWGFDQVNKDLLMRVLQSKDHRARAAAVRVLRYNGHRISNQAELLKLAADDSHGRVRMEAVVAASWTNKSDGLAIVDIARKADANKKTKKAPRGLAVHERDGWITFSDPDLAKQKIDRITIGLPGKNKILNLSEAQIISDGKNIIASARATQSSIFNNDSKVEKLYDGDKNNYAHCKEPDDNPWFRFTFRKPVTIDAVKIWNRRGYELRFDGGVVIFHRGSKEVARVKVVVSSGESSGNWLRPVLDTVEKSLNDEVFEEVSETPEYKTHLTGDALKSFQRGAELYNYEGNCATCHQPDGKGLVAAQFPPLDDTKWVLGSKDRLIKLALHGLHGPIEVKGKKYPGHVPMTAFKGLKDEELADILTFVRNAFGNKASIVTPEEVSKVRAETKNKQGFYRPDELLKQHPN